MPLHLARVQPSVVTLLTRFSSLIVKPLFKVFHIHVNLRNINETNSMKVVCAKLHVTNPDEKMARYIIQLTREQLETFLLDL